MNTFIHFCVRVLRYNKTNRDNNEKKFSILKDYLYILYKIWNPMRENHDLKRKKGWNGSICNIKR